MSRYRKRIPQWIQDYERIDGSQGIATRKQTLQSLSRQGPLTPASLSKSYRVGDGTATGNFKVFVIGAKFYRISMTACISKGGSSNGIVMTLSQLPVADIKLCTDEEQL